MGLKEFEAISLQALWDRSKTMEAERWSLLNQGETVGGKV